MLLFSPNPNPNPNPRCVLLFSVLATSIVDILAFYFMVIHFILAFAVAFQHLAGYEVKPQRCDPSLPPVATRQCEG